MARAFRRKGELYAARLDPQELGLVVGLLEQTRELLDRLLPDAHRSDPAIAAEFRRLTEHDLRRRKSDTITAAIDALRQVEGDKVRLTKADADSLLVALTDTRLLIGERLGLRDESDVDALDERISAHPEHPLAFAAAVYDFLTWLQDSLAGALMGRRLFDL